VGPYPNLRYNNGWVSIGLANGINPADNLDVSGGINSYSYLSVKDNGLPGGAPFVKIGDDAFLSDVDRADTVAGLGAQNPNGGIVEIGKGGAKVIGYPDGAMCIGSC
jgi:hypothetical protein